MRFLPQTARHLALRLSPSQGLKSNRSGETFLFFGSMSMGIRSFGSTTPRRRKNHRGVIDATSRFYSHDNSNIHRAAHALAARATDLYEGGREKVRQFIGAADTKEIVFVRGTTEAINLVAQTYGRTHIGRGDEILTDRRWSITPILCRGNCWQSKPVL